MVKVVILNLGATLKAVDKRNISCPCREWNHDFFVFQPATWSLRRLSYPVFRECYDLNIYGSLAVGIYVSPSSTISVYSPRRGSTAACFLELQVRIPPGQGYVSLVNVVCCKVEFLIRADPLARGILPCVCVCVCVRARVCVCACVCACVCVCP